MKTLCKLKNKKKKSKRRNRERLEGIAKFQCQKCDRLACSKKALCKASKI